jgi:hypothetical protein
MAGIVLNEDFENFMAHHPPEKMTEAGLHEQIDTYAVGQMKQLNFCGNGMRAIFDSEAFEPLYQGIEETEDGRAFAHGREILDTPLPMKRNSLNCQLLCRQVKDHLQTRIDYGRKRGLKVFLSMRMNDLHWVPDPDLQLNSDFWRNHPEFHRAPYQAQWPGKALDYAEPAVYDHFMSLTREYLERFDLDGLELDWMRTPPHFRPGNDTAGAAILNRFMRETRQLADAAEKRTGHRIELTVRVPNRPDDARRLGFDVPTWIRENLIDQLTVTSYWGVTDFDPQIELYRQLIGPDFPLLAGLEIICRATPEGKTSFFNTAEIVRGFAASFLHRGADMIYLFNHMDGATGMHDKAAWRRLLFEIGSLETLDPLSRRHVVTFCDSLSRGEGLRLDNVLPLVPNPNYPAIRINVGGCTADRQSNVLLGFKADSVPAPDELELRLNGIVVPTAIAPDHPELPDDITTIIAGRIPPAVLHDGDNLLEFGGNNPKQAAVEWCEIDISHKD